jgi:hypothetical protein
LRSGPFSLKLNSYLRTDFIITAALEDFYLTSKLLGCITSPRYSFLRTYCRVSLLRPLPRQYFIIMSNSNYVSAHRGSSLGSPLQQIRPRCSTQFQLVL